MAVYAVYAPPGDPTRPELADQVVFVREGFRFLAFLLPWLYFLLHRAWLPLVMYLIGLTLVNLVATALGVSSGLVFLANLLYAILIGVEAPGLRQWSLTRKGLGHVASVVARRVEEAEMRFFCALDARAPRREPAARTAPAGMPREVGHALLFAEAERPR